MDKRIVEINGVRLEVDLSTARVVDSYKIGDNVKVLVKEYSSYQSYPGVIIGFDEFKSLPTIVIAYLEAKYSSAEVKFVHLNSETKDCEICPALVGEIPFAQERVIDLLNRGIEKAEQELAVARGKKLYFLEHFGVFFKNPEEVDAAKS